MSAQSGPRDDQYDVIVIGSGLGGVSAAAILAKTGRKVLVLEQGDGAGGFAHAFKRGPYTFDSAVRVIAEGEMIENLLDFLDVRDQCTLIQIDHLYRAKFPDGFQIFAPTGLEEFMEAHIRHFPAEEQGIRQFFGLRRQLFLEAAQLPMQLGPADLDAAMQRFPTLFKFRTATLGEVLDEHFTDPKLKAVSCALWPYMGSDPYRLSFFAYSQFLGVLIDGPFYVQGSFQKLVDAFVTALERNGGELVLQTPVTKVLVENGQAHGVELAGGQRVHAPVIISNADARQTFDELVGAEQLPAPFMRRLGRMKPSMSAFVIYTATKQDLLQFNPAHETFIYNHWDHRDTWRDIMAGKPGGMSLSVMTMLDPDLAPPDEHIIIITAVAPYDIGAPWPEVKERYTEELLGQFDDVLPGYRDELLFVQSGTPLTLERYTRNYRGATYGWELIPAQIGSKRLAHQSPVDGLYLSGHWTEEGPASFRVVLSGINTARLILAQAGEGNIIPSFKPADIPPLAV